MQTMEVLQKTIQHVCLPIFQAGEIGVVSFIRLPVIFVSKSFAYCTGNGQFVPRQDSKRLRRKFFFNGMFLNAIFPMNPVNRNSESRLWTLMARKLAGEATQDELIELEVLVQKSPDAHYVIEILSLWWELSEKSGKEQAEKAVADLLAQLEKANDTLHINKKGGINSLVLV
jgi:hypothetical protein